MLLDRTGVKFFCTIVKSYFDSSDEFDSISQFLRVDTGSVCAIIPYVRTVLKICVRPSKQRDGLCGLLAIDAEHGGHRHRRTGSTYG